MHLIHATSAPIHPVVLLALSRWFGRAHNGKRNWEKSVKDNCRRLISTHTLKLWMVALGVIVPRIVVNTGDVKPNYPGPPESRKVGAT